MYKLFILILTLLRVTTAMKDTDDRIVGGYRCSTEDYRFMARLVLNKTKKYYFVCGSTLVNHFWSLTAAHCLDNRSDVGASYYIKVDLSRHPKGFINVPVTEMFIHPKYSTRYWFSRSWSNDIALLKLDNTLDYINWGYGDSKGQLFVHLPFDSTGMTGNTPCSIGLTMGWGRLREGQQEFPKNADLQCTRLRFVSIPQCQRTFRSVRALPHICALGNKTDTCKGDSGGPLLCGQVQVGMVSWGRGCARDNIPKVFVRVESYLSFITETMNKKKSIEVELSSVNNLNIFKWLLVFMLALLFI